MEQASKQAEPTESVVNCASYSEGCRIANVPIEDISEAIKVPGQFVWLGLHEPDAALLRTIQQEFGLHDLAVEDALTAHQRPKLEEYGDELFIVLRTPHMENDHIAPGETHFFVGRNHLISIRHGSSLAYTDVRKRCEATPQLLRKGPAFVLYALMDFIVDHYFPITDALEGRLENLEEEIFSGDSDKDTIESIYDLKRDLLVAKKAVSPLIDVCNRLLRLDSTIVPDDTRPYFRDVYDHVVRINETVDTLRELVTSTLEAKLSLVSVAQNDVTKKLAAWAAILAVPTMIAGIYGMNFEIMPELHWQYGYHAVMVGMISMCGFLYWRFKRSGWL